jgi:hypothetical protein
VNPSQSPRSRQGLFFTVLLGAFVLATPPAMAHVELDSPNGGEVLESGSVVTIEWRDTISHGPANYDLWYSTSGANGPWIDIVSDLMPPPVSDRHSFQWTVPNTSSDQVRVRVRQDNSDADYEDMSDSNLTIMATTESATVSLEPVQDATLYEGDGSLANGVGSYLFTGYTEVQNGVNERRALLAFDIAGAIPPGATITQVSLDLNLSRTISGNHTVELRRITESWSEGPSNPPGQEGGGAPAQDGDATWVHRAFPSNFWSTEGGSLAATPSASFEVGGTGSYSLPSTPGLVADVQSWLDDPDGNYGWALVIPTRTAGNAKRFDSRENGTASRRPRLMVSYEGGTAPIEERILIPAAADVAGAAGSFFITTVDVHNTESSAVTFRFEWLPRNTDNSMPQRSAEYTLGPGETRRFQSFLEEVFGLSDAAGAASVVSASDGLKVMSRTFNQADQGTFGQSLPGVSDAELIPDGATALVLFLTENADFRSNLGLVNGTETPITVRWELFNAAGTSLATGSANLPPLGNTQRNRVLQSHAPIEAAYAHVWTTTPGGRFTCYGSVLDAATSDPTTVPPS